MNSNSKILKIFLLSALIILPKLTIAQVQNPAVQHQDVLQCEIMQIGLTDSATHVFFKYTSPNENSAGSWMCAGEDFYIKDNATGKKYKMINSLNIPICPAKEIFDENNQVHYFSLSFQPLPKETKEIDIIENPAEGFNFYGVSLQQLRPIDNSIDYVNLLEETPVKESGIFIKDGRNIQYFVHNGLVITMHLTVEKAYGKYYTAYISIENHSKKNITFYPESITAKFINKKLENALSVLSFAEYMKKVNRTQNWNSFFVALGESNAANKAGYNTSQSYSNTKGYENSNSYSSGYFGNDYGSVSTNVRTYSNYSTKSTTYNYDATANYYAQQNARNNIAKFDSQQYEIKESINQGYLKSNTIFPDQRINGYVNIEYKKGDYTVVNININGENYSFVWFNSK